MANRRTRVHSSELALFYENGPFKITNNMSLVWNDYSWDKISNILFVDQPTGTGFSYSSSDQDTRHDETGVSNDLYNFLQALIKWFYSQSTLLQWISSLQAQVAPGILYKVFTVIGGLGCDVFAFW
ncbi:hypothetical protein L2E82_18370 [Cichorium intybus]|uniref:Uncharacterized protein n=1 Tax=Cichorium intybus TaxID=13427 RepID=A0ACB9FAT6_CICIN|nr:hypothetical protein L2E82_18370 [Cichorium intybus]